MSLTSVFEMGTGVASPLKAPGSPNAKRLTVSGKPEMNADRSDLESPKLLKKSFGCNFTKGTMTYFVSHKPLVKLHKKVNGPISTPRLNVLPRLHLVPINQIVFLGSHGET